MNFGFTEEQELLRNEVRRFLDERCPMTEVRRIMELPNGFCEKLWVELAELGWLGLTIPEEYGGAGLGWIDEVVLLEETGRSLFPSPLLSNLLASTAILENGSEAQQQRWLPSLVDGSRIATTAIFEKLESLDPDAIQLRGKPEGEGFRLTGEKHLVSDPEVAHLFVVPFRCGENEDDLRLAVVDSKSEGVEAKSFPIIDETKRLGILELDGVQVGSDDLLCGAESARAAIDRMIDQGAIATSAESAGAVDSAMRLTVAYAKERVQFEEPIGHFQGVKHPLAEIYLDLESFKSLVYYGAWLLENDGEELSRVASLAKAYATDTFVRTGLDSIQLHGAIGFTTDYDIQLYFKRSKWARPMYGDADSHYERSFALRVPDGF